MTQTHELTGKTVVVTRATSGHGRGPHGGCTLAPAMAETAAVGEPSRTVNISSSGHRGGHIDVDDLQERAAQVRRWDRPPERYLDSRISTVRGERPDEMLSAAAAYVLRNRGHV